MNRTEAQTSANLIDPSLATAARILCVDDNAETLAVYESVLKPCGYEVVKATSSKDAFDILLTQPVDLLIQDLVRPNINGIELYGMMKAVERLQKIPIIICSGSIEHQKESLSCCTEVAAVLSKPFRVKTLVDVVRKALGRLFAQPILTVRLVEQHLDCSSVKI